MANKLKPWEKWLPVNGFNGRYDVSDMGRVRGWFVGRQRLNNPRCKVIQKDKDGYPFVILYAGERIKGFRVSRLMLLTFKPISDPGHYEASHLNGNKSDNRLDNLSWETKQQNEDRKIAHGTRPCGENNKAHKLSAVDVEYIRTMRGRGIKLSELANGFGITESNVSLICKGKTWNRRVKEATDGKP